MTEPASAPLARLALAAAAGAASDGCWLVGGAVRDALLGDPEPLDLDLATTGDVARVAKAVADTLKAPRFPLSDRYGGFRVTAAGGLQVDVMPVAPGGLADDLRRRDTTVNALAIAAADAATSWPRIDRAFVIDELGGLEDLAGGVQRACGPDAMLDDPLRVLRLARAVGGRPWKLDGETVRLARAAAGRLSSVAGERIGAELRGTLGAPRPLAGLAALERTGGLEAVLPEVRALDGIQQSPYHHLDVGGHTREVVDWSVALESRLADFVDDDDAAAATVGLDDEVAGGWTVRDATRFGALLHDIAKPRTQVLDERRGFYGFPHHDRVGEQMAGEIMERLRAPRKVVRMVQGLTRHHLRLGFMVHAQPLGRDGHYDYLSRCDPVEVEVTVLSLADRLATRGRRAEEAIEAHAALAREVLPVALQWRRDGGAPAPLLDGDALIIHTGRSPGPWLAGALERQRRARYLDPELGSEQALEAALAIPSGE
ncbi:MAG: HD domain-containing protein [Solirubrobacteraceae bacterium]|nr:HD domain-containing protein [Solirubrobacteraceae bacterium]